ncbi:MAG: hypothetical protein K8S87_05605 [Planctomycetes bacterium]|nr:hypothetical protein [Planctomycetota bacterium]
MKTSEKVILLIISCFVILPLSNSAIINAEEVKYTLRIAHHVGELRTANISKILTHSMVEVADNSKEIDKKIIVSEQNLAETCLAVDETGMPTRLFLQIVKSRYTKKDSKDNNEKSTVYSDSDEGKSKVLYGEKLEKYRKLQQDFGLILPNHSVNVGSSWKPDEKQIKRLFDKKIQGKNTIDFKLVEIKKNEAESASFAVIERQLMMNFAIQDESEKTKSTGIEKSRTTYVIDIDNKRLMSVSEAQVLIVNVAGNGKHQLMMKLATETNYEYSEASLYEVKSHSALEIEQTERTFVNFNLKMLITTKKDDRRFVTSKMRETDRIIRRKASKITNNKVVSFELSCDYDRTIQVDKAIDGKKTVTEPDSPLEGNRFNIQTADDGKKTIKDSNGKDVSTEIVLPGSNPSGVSLNLPKFAIPIGYNWVIENENAQSILKDMFAGIKLDKVSAQVVFTRVFADKSGETIAEFKLEIAITGETRDSGRIIFAITVFNHLNIDEMRIVRIFTDKARKNDAMLRLRFESESVSVDGIGSLQIDTQYFYSDQEKEMHKIVGNWNLVNRETGKISDAYTLEFSETGLLKYIHPHINGRDEIVDIGVWRVENDILSVKIGRKRDIFSIKIDEQTLFLTKAIKTSESANIFPWRVKQTDKYLKSTK